MTVGGVLRKCPFFVMSLPYSDAFHVQVFERECTESFREGHVRAFEFFGAVPTRISHDNTKVAVARMLEGRERIYFGLGDHPEFENRLLGWVSSIRARESGGARPPGELFALKHLLHEQRLLKSAAEIRVMREAADITCHGHLRAMDGIGSTVDQVFAEPARAHLDRHVGVGGR